MSNFDDDNDHDLDPLKLARRDLVLRQIRNEDLKMSVAERQLMRTSVHHEALSDVVSTMITFLDTLPDVLERKLALESPIVVALRDSVDAARDNLHDKLVELLRNTDGNRAEKDLDTPAAQQPAKKRGRPTNAERALRGTI